MKITITTFTTNIKIIKQVEVTVLSPSYKRAFDETGDIYSPYK